MDGSSSISPEKQTQKKTQKRINALQIFTLGITIVNSEIPTGFCSNDIIIYATWGGKA